MISADQMQAAHEAFIAGGIDPKRARSMVDSLNASRRTADATAIAKLVHVNGLPMWCSPLFVMLGHSGAKAQAAIARAGPNLKRLQSDLLRDVAAMENPHS